MEKQNLASMSISDIINHINTTINSLENIYIKSETVPKGLYYNLKRYSQLLSFRIRAFEKDVLGTQSGPDQYSYLITVLAELAEKSDRAKNNFQKMQEYYRAYAKSRSAIKKYAPHIDYTDEKDYSR